MKSRWQSARLWDEGVMWGEAATATKWKRGANYIEMQKQNKRGRRWIFIA